MTTLPPPVSAATRLLALLGNPVAHSLSPAIQNAALASAGVDARYLALRCDASEVGGLIRGLARAGGGGNVTLPHKGIAADTVEVPSELVVRTGACNTFWLQNGRIHGENTDVLGFARAAEALLGGSLAGLRVGVIGAGGAARGALVALQLGGAGEIYLWNRTADRAVALARELGGRVKALPRLEELADRGPDLVVNATTLGLASGDPLPFDPELFGTVRGVLDLVYRPGETELVHRARALGQVAADGGEMLVQQGAAAFECWCGVEPSLEVMRGALREGRELALRQRPERP